MGLQGKIISIYDDGKRAKVLVKPSQNCNGCNVCAGLIKSSNSANLECEVEALTNNFDVKQGDIVKVELSEYQGSKVAFILYGLPIICFLLGMFLAPYCCSLLNVEVSDLHRVIGAFVGLFVSIILIFIITKYTKSDTFIMSVSQVC